MKFPKNRANVYVVLRDDYVICGVFAELTDAEDFKGACQQEFKDKVGLDADFQVFISTFYG